MPSQDQNRKWGREWEERDRSGLIWVFYEVRDWTPPWMFFSFYCFSAKACLEWHPCRLFFFFGIGLHLEWRPAYGVMPSQFQKFPKSFSIFYFLFFILFTINKNFGLLGAGGMINGILLKSTGLYDNVLSFHVCSKDFYSSILFYFHLIEIFVLYLAGFWRFFAGNQAFCRIKRISYLWRME